MADANRPLSQEEIDALLAALSNDALDSPGNEALPVEQTSGETMETAGSVEQSAEAERSASTPEQHRQALAEDPRLKRTMHLPVTMQVSLGGKSVPVKALLNWGIGTQFVLNHDWQQPVAVKINGLQVGHGRVMLVGNNFGIEITDWGRN